MSDTAHPEKDEAPIVHLRRPGQDSESESTPDPDYTPQDRGEDDDNQGSTPDGTEGERSSEALDDLEVGEEDIATIVEEVADGGDADWYGEGVYLFVNPVDGDVTRTLVSMVTVVDEQVGMATTELDPTGLRVVYDQIGDVLEKQSRNEWIETGNSPEDYPVDDAEDDSESDDEDSGGNPRWKGRARRVMDPAGLSRDGVLKEWLSRPSPFGSLTIGAVVFLAFIGLTALSMILSAVT